MRTAGGWVLATAALVASGCQAGGTDGAPPMMRAAPGGAAACNAAKAEFAIGRPATDEVTAEMAARAGARAVRVVRPGMAVTQDFSPDRLTIALDEKGRVRSVSCS